MKVGITKLVLLALLVGILGGCASATYPTSAIGPYGQSVAGPSKTGTGKTHYTGRVFFNVDVVPSVNVKVINAIPGSTITVRNMWGTAATLTFNGEYNFIDYGSSRSTRRGISGEIIKNGVSAGTWYGSYSIPSRSIRSYTFYVNRIGRVSRRY